MIAFYRYPEWISLAAGIICAAGLLSWSAAFLYEVYSSHKKKIAVYLDEAYQILTLVVWFSLQVLIAWTRMGIQESRMIVPENYLYRSILCTLAIFCYAIKTAAAIRSGEKVRVADVLPALLLLPWTESVSGNRYPCIFMAGGLLGAEYSLYRIYRYRRELKEELSWYSIKEAVDRLPTGVLFAGKEGTIRLCNLQMQKLSEIIFGSQIWDARRFDEIWDDEKEILNHCKKLKLDNNCVYLLPDDSVWLFSKSELTLKKQKEIEITATDITAQWKMTQELRNQKQELEEQRRKLKQSMEELQTAITEEEILNIRSRFHDILGQRIAILLRGLREGQSPDQQLLDTFLSEFYEEFSDSSGKKQSVEKLTSLCNVMDRIGVNLIFEREDTEGIQRIGAEDVINLTSEYEKGPGLCADICREACTNAVRHGFASEIRVTLTGGEELKMWIRNDGSKPEETIHEGGGLKSIRRKLEAVGGSLYEETDPQFTLCVTFGRR